MATPKALRSLFTFDLLYWGSSLSTALILSNDSILEISVIEKTVDKKRYLKAKPKKLFAIDIDSQSEKMF